MASASRPARTRKRNSGDRRRAGNYPRDPVSVRPGRLMLRGHSPPVPDVTLGEPRSLEYLDNKRLRHAHPDAGMLTMAARSGTGGSPAAVTDGSGAADVRR